MSASTTGVCYLLHFSRRYHHAGHYLGWTCDPTPERRIAEHLSSQGSPLVRAVVQAGITVELVATWPGTSRTFERKLHVRHGSRLCPRCKAPRRLRLFRFRWPKQGAVHAAAPTPRRAA